MYPYTGAVRLSLNISKAGSFYIQGTPSSWRQILFVAISVRGDRLGARGRYPHCSWWNEGCPNVGEQKPPVGSRRDTVRPGLGQDTVWNTVNFLVLFKRSLPLRKCYLVL